MNRIYRFIIFLLVLCIVSNLQASGAGSYETGLSESGNSPVNHSQPAAAIISATISGPSSVCLNETNQNITFTGFNGTAPYTFKFKLDGIDKNVKTIGTNSSVLVPIITAIAKSYTFELDSVIDSNNERQVQSGSVIVKVNTLPTFDFTSTDNQCSGTGVQFSPSLKGNYSYAWDFGDGTTSSEESPAHLFNAFGNGTTTYPVKLTITDNSTSCNNTVSRNIVVTQLPDATLNSSGTTDVFNGVPLFKICSNSVTTFTYTNGSSTTGTNTHYKINWGDGSPDFDAASWTITTHTYQIGLWNLTYTVDGPNGCKIIKPYIVFVGSNPAVSLGNPGNTDICISQSLTFPITGTSNNPPGTTYTISFNDGSPNQVFQHPAPVEVTHTFLKSSCGITTTPGYPNSFFAKIVATNPCSTSEVSVVPIYVSIPPIADFAMASTSGCTTSQVCFTNTTTNANEINSGKCTNKAKLIWTISPSVGVTLGSGSYGNDFGSADPGIWTTGSDVICPVFSIPGTYTITMKTANRCGTDQKVKTICIEAPIQPQFSLNTVQGCSPLNVTANNTTVVTATCNPPVFKWTVSYSANYCGNSSAYIYTSGTSSSSLNPSFQFTNPGIYTIQLAVTTGCGTKTTSQTVTVTKPPTVSINVIPDACGTAIFTPLAVVNNCAPAPGAVTYAWNFPGGSPASSTSLNPGTITYNTTGTYTVSLVVTNDCGASVTATKTFTVKPVPTITNTVLAQTICSGLKTELVTLTSDLPNVTYSWNATATAGITGFQSSGTTNVLPVVPILNSKNTAGTVTFLITPSLNGCSGNVVTYVVTVNPSATITTQPVSNQSVCIGGTITPLSFVNTGLGTPSYQWYKNTLNSNTSGTDIPGQTNATYTPPTDALGTLYYYCAITFTGGGCSNLTTNVAAITVSAEPVITIQPKPVQTVCMGGTIPAALSVSYTGGAGSPSYQWYSNLANTNSGGTPITGATNSTYTPPVFNAVGTFYYYAEVKFTGSNCNMVASDTARINVVALPVITGEPVVTQTLCLSSVPADLTVAVNGGAGLFSYQWYSNTSNNTSTGTKIIPATTNTFTPPTTTVGMTYYYCIISQPNAGGCIVTSIISQVIVNASPTFTKHPASSTVCLGVTPPVLSVETINGIGTPQYQWYQNTLNSVSGSISINGATTLTYAPPSGVAGTKFYYCVVTFPTGGCSTITSNIAQVTINAVPVISTYQVTINSGKTFSVTPFTQNGDTVPAGTTYTWTAPVISPLNAITGSSSKLTAQASISQTLTNTTTSIATATYTVTPIAGTCTGATFKVIVTVNPPLNPNVTLKDITCFGVHDGSIQTAIQGGVPFKSGNPYLITWTGPGGFTSALPVITDLYPGTYSLTVKDSVGTTVNNTYLINQPNDVTISANILKDAGCFGAGNGEISLTVTGGTTPYAYAWTKDGFSFPGSGTITNLSPGNYVVTVTDKNNCAPKTASFAIQQPAEIKVTLKNQVNVICYGDKAGSVSVDVTGGVPMENIPGVFTYSYAWKGPNGFSSTLQNLVNIAAGDYQLTVTDKTGCTQTFTATITQTPQLKIDAVTTPVTCYGANDASIQLSLSGGIPPYQVQWSNLGKGLFQDNLSPGTYTVLITDSAGCSMSRDIVIAEAAFSIQPVVKQITCQGAHNGSIVLNILGGVQPITLTWNDNATAGNIRNQLAPGTYTVTVKDKSSCDIHKSFTIVEPTKLAISAVITHAMDCTVPNTGAIQTLVSGGTTPYRYAWTNGKTTKNLTSLQGGTYGLTVTDSSGCSMDTVFEVIRPLPLALSVKAIPDFDCVSHSLKEICTAQVTGGVPPYHYTWSYGTTSGASNETMTTSQPGLVTLGVTDSRGCTAGYTFTLIVPVPGIVYQVLDCDAHTIGFKAIIPTGMEANYTYLWDFGDSKTDTSQNPQHSYATPGNYTVNLTLIGATCTSVFKLYLTMDAMPVLKLDKLPVFCTGDSLLLHVSGATTYRWGNGSSGDSLLIKQPGDYTVTGTSKQGCSVVYPFKATNFDSYNYTIQSDKNEVTTSNPDLQFWSESIQYSDYFWDFGDNQTADGNVQNHTYNIQKDGYYDVKLKVKNPNGCMEYATKRIWITDASMGNVFSPAYDLVYMKGFHIQVYNRNGFLLYDGSDGWDGKYKDKPVTNDTYFYVLYLSGESGVKTKSGFVTVVR
ncbi:MAG: PKD domain-containing protein [Paludibacter sp.]|nr:PKD domain-containing protein [Paludibacter sp.]